MSAKPDIASTSVPKPGFARWGPVCPHPDKRTMTSLGLISNSRSGPRPNRSSPPGTKFSTMASAVSISCINTSTVVLSLQIERNAALVARVDLPEDLDILHAPAAKVVTLLGMLYLDDIRAEVGKDVRHHVPGNKPRQVDDPNVGKRPARSRLGTFGSVHELPSRMPPTPGFCCYFSRLYTAVG